MNSFILKHLFPALFVLTLLASAPARAEQTPDPESAALNIMNLVQYQGFEPYVSLSYPSDMRLSGDDLYVEQQYIGYMITLEPGENKPGVPYYQVIIMVVRSYESAISVLDQYLDELDSYLATDYAHHTITSVIRADGAQFAAFPGRGYVANGVVTADGPSQGHSYSEEFRNFVLPGNTDLRIIFRYPTAVENNEDMRKSFEAVMGTLVVHADVFNLAGDTNLTPLRLRDRPENK